MTFFQELISWRDKSKRPSKWLRNPTSSTMRLPENWPWSRVISKGRRSAQNPVRSFVLIWGEGEFNKSGCAGGTISRVFYAFNLVEVKIVDLEEELRTIGENLNALEIAEEKAQQREEEYKKTIKTLSEKHKNAESR